MQKIGIMGGTFDPIHTGHMIMAQVAQVACGLNKVIFIPSACPPHKQDKNVTDADERLEMVQLAISGNDTFVASDIEMKRKGPSYSIDTVRELKQKYPEADFYFIIGMDSLLDLYKWHCPEELLKECKFIVCNRPGYNFKDASPELKKLLTIYSDSYMRLDSVNIEISSTNIRERIANGLPYQYMLPAKVYEFLNKHNLYGATVGSLLVDLHTHLSEERYEHTLSVADVAVELADLYHVDPEKARLAALLHDNAKNTKNPCTLLSRCLIEDKKAYQLTVNDFSILHAFAGVGRALALYPALLEDDIEIQNAIRFHTTGRMEMTPLEQIIYIADFIDPKREEFPERSVAFEMAFNQGLDATCAYILSETIKYLKQKDKKIHKLTLDAELYYRNKTGNRFNF